MLGIVAFIYTGFTYTTKDTVAAIGPLELKANKKHNISWSPIAGVVMVVGGMVLLAMGRKGRR